MRRYNPLFLLPRLIIPSSTLAGSDSPRHLNGTSLFFPPQPYTQSSPLRQAVFWIHLSQEIYNAYSHQRSVRTDFSPHDIDSFIEDTSSSEDMWYHRILHIAAHVSKWAFSDELTHLRWRELRQMISDWEHDRPASFSPIFNRERDPQARRYFPEVCYTTHEALMASHYVDLSKLLLTTHDPTIPRIGSAVKTAATAMQETALSYVRSMVGSAICNSLFTARVTGSLVVLMCEFRTPLITPIITSLSIFWKHNALFISRTNTLGLLGSAWITDRGEQLALLEFMQVTDRCSGWPRGHARRRLMEEWDLNGST